MNNNNKDDFFTFTDNGKILISNKFKFELKSYPENIRLFFDYDGKMAIWTEYNALINI